MDTKQRFGDWETDTITGENNRGTIVTMVERQTFMMMEKLEHKKNAQELAKAVTRMLMAYMNHVHTMTGDNGTEFAAHQKIAKELKIEFFFTHLRKFQ